MVRSMRRNGMPITKRWKDLTGDLIIKAAVEAEDYLTAQEWVRAVSGNDCKVVSIRGAGEETRFVGKSDSFWTPAIGAAPD
jgi:hypothetical protein